MLTITYGVSSKTNLFLPLFLGHIHEKMNFCLLAEESPLILLANWSAAEAIRCISWSKYSSTFFFPKPFSTFTGQSHIHRLVTVIASESICPVNLFPIKVLNFILY